MIACWNLYATTKRRRSSILLPAEQLKAELDLNINPVEYNSMTKMAATQATQQAYIAKLTGNWKDKPCMTEYPQQLEKADVTAKTHQWMKIAGLKSETEGFIVAADKTKAYDHESISSLHLK